MRLQCVPLSLEYPFDVTLSNNTIAVPRAGTRSCFNSGALKWSSLFRTRRDFVTTGASGGGADATAYRGLPAFGSPQVTSPVDEIMTGRSKEPCCFCFSYVRTGTLKRVWFEESLGVLAKWECSFFFPIVIREKHNPKEGFKCLHCIIASYLFVALLVCYTNKSHYKSKQIWSHSKEHTLQSGIIHVYHIESKLNSEKIHLRLLIHK